MRRQHTTPDAYPARLLDEHLRVLLRTSRTAPAAAALHTRSADARLLLAHAAGVPSLTELLAAAHGRPGVHPPLSRMDPFPLGELARVTALQDLSEDDPADGLALFDLLLAAFGPDRVDASHQGLHCQLAFALGRRDRTVALLATYPDVPETVRAGLLIDLANPYAGGTGTPDAWLAAFGALLPGPRLSLDTGAGPAIDRLTAGPARRTGSPHRVTTIVTTYRPGPALLTTVRSLVAQSWTHQEILVVDDGSPAAFEAALRQAAALDPRVRLIRMPTNGGTYVARNAGLDAATGDLVTFQDSDDWSHPRRLERQAEALLADPDLVATTSVGMRVTEDLVVTRPGWPQQRSYNLSSLMLRREPALRRLGYLDVVRKGADAEYVERARAVFGRPAVRHLTGAPLALIRLTATSLSSADMRAGWMHPARHAYLSAFQAWHRRVAAGVRQARLPRQPADRVFAAPRRLSGAAGRTRYDVVLVGDWTSADQTAAGRLRCLAARRLGVALVQVDAMPNLADGPRTLDVAVQDLVNAGTVDQVVFSDEVTAELLIVTSPAVLHFAPDIDCLIRADRVVIEIAGPAERYAPAHCAATARRLFGAEPLWAPRSPSVRRLLDAAPDTPPLAPVDLPGTVDAALWRLDRRGPRSDRPVVGRLCGSGRGEWRRLRELLPDSGRLDVRLLHAEPGGRAARGGAGAPGAWLVYEPAETSLRSFLYQVDFYLPAPTAASPGDADPAVLQALAAGCVVVLPRRYAATFGDAAVYCAPADLEPVVDGLHARPEEFLRQSRAGQEFVRRRYGHERYAEGVMALRN